MQWKPGKTFDNARDKFDQAWSELLSQHVFFGSQMFSLEIIETTSIPTMATDGKRLLYNPDFVLDMNVEETFTIQLHEIFHIVHLHPIISAEMKLELGEKYNHYRFNVAADEEINWQLKDAKLPIETHGIYDKKFHGMLLREIYFLLEDEENEAEKETEKDDGNGDNSSDDSVDSGDDSNGEDSGDDTGMAGESNPESNGNDDDSSPNDGDSIAADSANKDDQITSGEIITPTSESGNDLSKDEIEEMKYEAQKKQIVAAKFARKQGDNSQAIDDVLSQRDSAKVDWKETLEEFFSRELDAGNRWERPDKRFFGHGITLPSRQIERVGRGVIMNDLSGSVDNTLAKLWQDIVNENLSQFEDLEIMIINFDDQVVGEIETLSTDDFPFKLKRMSHGGTDFRPPFDALIEADFEPDFILVLTDLLCNDFPDTEPDCPVLWCEACSPYYRGYQGKPPFGETTRVER